MDGASKTAELSSPPRKVKWKRWALALATLLALAALVLRSPTPPPVAVKFVGTTNFHGGKMLLFRATNGLPRMIAIQAWVTDTFADIAQFDNGNPPNWNRGDCKVAAGAARTFMCVPLREDADPYVMWVILDLPGTPETRTDKARMACVKFLQKHGMKTLARPFRPALRHPHYILPADSKE